MDYDQITPPDTPGKSYDQESAAASQASTSTDLVSDTASEMEMEIIVEPQVPGGYYSVESILGHKVKRNGDRQFQVKWDGYVEATWEPEDSLDGCVSLLQEYIARHNLVSTKIIARAGASAGLPSNPLNWITADHVIKTVNSFINTCAYKTDLDLVPLTSPLQTDRDGLYWL